MNKKTANQLCITGDGCASDNDVEMSVGLDQQLVDVSIEEDCSEITNSKGRPMRGRLTLAVQQHSKLNVPQLKRKLTNTSSRTKASRLQDSPTDQKRKAGVKMFRTQVIQDYGEKTLANGMVVRHLWPVKQRVEVFKDVQPLASIPSFHSSKESHSSLQAEPQVASNTNFTETTKMAKYFSNLTLAPPDSAFGSPVNFSQADDYVQKGQPLASSLLLTIKPADTNIKDITIFDRYQVNGKTGKFRQNVILNQQQRSRKNSRAPQTLRSKFEKVMADFTGLDRRVSPPRVCLSNDLDSTKDTTQKALFKRNASKVNTILQKYKRQFPQKIAEMDSQQRKNWILNYNNEQRQQKSSFQPKNQDDNFSSALESSKINARNCQSRACKTVEPQIDEKKSLAFRISAGGTIDDQSYKQKFFRIFEKSIRNRNSRTTNVDFHFKAMANSFDSHNSTMEPIPRNITDTDGFISHLKTTKTKNKNHELKRLLDETAKINSNDARAAHEMFEAEALVRVDNLQFKQKQILKFQKRHIRRDMITQCRLPEPNSVFSQLKKNIMNLIK